MSAKNCRWNPVHYVQRRQYCDYATSSCQLMRDRLSVANNLYRKDLYSHFGCVNAIEFSNEGEWLVSGGDDRRVLVWNVEKALQGRGGPISMKGEHGSNIFCLGFDNDRHKIFSAGNDEQVIVHDFKTGTTVDVFLHEEAVYGLSVEPLNDNVFASACEDGRILIWDIREPSSTDPFCLANFTSAFHSVMYNPVEPRLIATANSKEGIALWDVRAPRKSCLVKYSSGASHESCMSVRFNRAGTQILALRRRLPPVLFDLHTSTPACQFDHREYYNSCTMKSCCFAGDDDQYVLSGSDDFNLYMWKVPNEGSTATWVDEAHLVLKGHRSIVNQVRFNPSNFLLASSGVEKIIKLWSPFPIPLSKGGLNMFNDNFDKERKVYSHEEYISLILQSGQVMSHDYSHKSTREDPRMMAFFDSLVQREIEGWNSDTSISSANTEHVPTRIEPPVPSESSSDSSSEGEPGMSGRGLSPLTVAYVNAIANRVGIDLDEQHSAEQQATTIVGTQTSNRISQLIAQKRQQLLKASRAKNAQRMKTTQGTLVQHLSNSTVTLNESQPKVRIRHLDESSSDESDSPLKQTKLDETSKSSVSTSTGAKVNKRTDNRRHLRSKRAKILSDKPDSDSDEKSSPVVKNGSSAELPTNGAAYECTTTDLTNGPSTSEQYSGGSSRGRTSCIDSGTSDVEDRTTPTNVNDNGENNMDDAGTPDSGIATSENADTNGALNSNGSAWSQFKRIRSRLERACRNYRSRSSDNGEGEEQSQSD